MSISVTCPACQAKLKMPEALIGKKVRCKACQAVIPTVAALPDSDSGNDINPPQPAASSEEKKAKEKPTTMAAASIDTPDAALVNPKMTTRRKTTASSRKSALDGTRDTAPPQALPAWKKFILYVSQRPWAAMLLFYLFAYAPIAFSFPASTTLIEMLAGLLFLVGIVGGTIMALIGVSIRNPFEMLTLATVGVIAGAVMPTEYASAVGKVAGKATGKTGQRPLGEADTGVGGSIAIYSCLGLVLLFVHTMIKTMVWVAAEKAKM